MVVRSRSLVALGVVLGSLYAGHVAQAANTPPAGWAPSAASWLGGSDDGVVAGVAIQSDGTVVLAATIGSATPG